MSRVNQKQHQPAPRTHEGATAVRIPAEDQLKRTLLACMLWEDGFYESGQTVADRIETLAAQCKPEFLSKLAIQARTENKLRHAPLYLLLELCRHGGALASDTIYHVVNRPDELAELVAMYWKDGRKPLPNSMKRGLARAITKFDEYQLAKWDKESADIKLRDVLFMVHAKPKDKDQEAVFKRLTEDKLKRPETWESRAAGGMDKGQNFTDLLKRGKLGYMALLRNLRNMEQANVPDKLVRDAILKPGKNMVLPFRFLSAVEHAPKYVNELNLAMMKVLENHDRLAGSTAIVVDCSGSMTAQVSGRSEITRLEAASAMAILLSGICEEFRVVCFGQTTKEIPAHRGLALRDAIRTARVGHATMMELGHQHANRLGCDRVIIVSDEQSRDRLSNPVGTGWMINVAANKNGVGYGAWNHIDGFSESCIEYIQEYEAENMQ